MYQKIKKVNAVSEKLKKILCKAKKKNNYELMAEVIEAYAFLHVSWNQQYADKDMECAIEYLVGGGVQRDVFSYEKVQKKTVVFHDAFGVDMWDGLGYIYIDALLSLGYRVIHISNILAQNKQPLLKEKLKDKNIIFEYYCSCAARIPQMESIINIVNQYKPEMAFLYTAPWDVAAILAYSQYRGVMKRFLIDATDHTFGVGFSIFDKCIEFRNYGANLSVKYRGCTKEQVVILPYYPIADLDIGFEGFPFETEGFKVVFSGGAPYKTYDVDNTFFRLVERMLDKHQDVIFVYAPKSDELNCQFVKEKYPDRFYQIEKRKDLYQVMKHSYLYLNTYPVGGGLMVQYAVMAGKYVCAVAEDDDGLGVLDEHVEDSIYYHSFREMEKDMDLLLDNTEYLKEKEEKVKNAVITRAEFIEELSRVIHFQNTKYPVTEKQCRKDNFERVFRERFDFRYIWGKAMLRDEMRPKLLKFFPVYFIKKEVKTVCILLKMAFKI